MKQKAVKMQLTQGPVAKTLLLFALPFMLSSLLQTLYSTVDTIVVGQFVGSAGLSAVSVSANLVNLSITLCMGFSTAGQILIAQCVGATQTQRIKDIIVSLAAAVCVVSVVIGAVLLVFLNPILRLLSTPPEAFQMARQYMIVCACGILFTGLYNLASAIFRGLGDSRRPFLFIAISSLCNLVLDLLFVGLFHLSTFGAALATVLSQLISVVFSAVFLIRNRAQYYLAFPLRQLRVSARELKMLIRLGVPLMLSSSAVSVSSLFVSRFVNQLGVTVSAAFGVGQKLSQIPNILTQAVGQGATAMIGQNLGARKFERVRATVRWALIVNLICSCGFAAVCLCFPRLSFRLFTQDASVLDYALTWNIAMAIGAPAMAMLFPFNGLIQAVGDTKITMAIGISDAFVGRVLLTLLLGITFHLGAVGFFVGFTLATYISVIPAVCYYLFVPWERRGIHGAQPQTQE